LTWAAGGLVAAAVLSGCTTTVTGTASPEPTGGIAAGVGHGSAAPTTPPGPSADAVRAVLLQLGDLPAGWAAQGEAAADGGDMPDLEVCLGARDTTPDRFVSAGSPPLTNASGTLLFSTVDGFLSQRDVDDDTALLADPRAADCLKTAVEQGMSSEPEPSGATLGAVSLTVTQGSAGGPGNVVASADGSVPVSAHNGRHATVYFGAVFITGRRTEAEIFFISAGAPLVDSIRSAAVAAVAQRVASL
jgi:hypothetical protein